MRSPYTLILLVFLLENTQGKRRSQGNTRDDCAGKKKGKPCKTSTTRKPYSTTTTTTTTSTTITTSTSTTITTTTPTSTTTKPTTSTSIITTRAGISRAAIFVPLSIFLVLLVLLAAFILQRFYHRPQWWRRLKRGNKDTVQMKPGSNSATIYTTAGHPQGNDEPGPSPQTGHIYQEISDVPVTAPDSSYSTIGLPYREQKTPDQQPAEGQYSLLGLPTGDAQQQGQV
ncbi:coiled-coil domain-containing protein 80-like isoform X2 [Dendropsophus ebraccatus]|uniref:coiled-coil domain-containing protein 80-like isoform X2 n=1 Tax=Dendropsophus ebraccatus TaxID=150705 RepID=UPI00383149BF